MPGDNIYYKVFSLLSSCVLSLLTFSLPLRKQYNQAYYDLNLSQNQISIAAQI